MNVKSNKFKIPHNRKRSCSNKTLFTHPSNCAFCTKKLTQDFYPKMIFKALYTKFSSSQNYYYTRDINDILANSRAKTVINFKDQLTWNDNEDEYLKRYYQIQENDFKMKMLAEYYKFHKDIPRLFMLPICDSLNKYHDKKRRIEYFRIKKMLREEGAGNISSDKKTISSTENPSGSKIKEQFTEKPFVGKILEELDLTSNSKRNSSFSLLELNKKLQEITADYRTNSDFTMTESFLSTQQQNNEVSLFFWGLDNNKPEQKTTTIAFKKNKEIFAGIKKLDLTKISKLNNNFKHDQEIILTERKTVGISRPLSSNKNTPISLLKSGVVPRNVNAGISARKLHIPSNNLFLQEGGSKTVRENMSSIKTARVPVIERDSSSIVQKKPINSDRMSYEKILEKQKKSIIEIMNEAALKLSKIKPTTKASTNKVNHNRVSSMAITSQKTSARFEKPNTHITYNNFFKTKSSNSQHKSSVSVKKANNDENYYIVKKKEENNSPIVTITKAGHKYTKSDPNLVFPKMTVVTLENNISDNNSGIKTSGSQKRNGKKISANLNSARSGSSQFYTINQNNILNIYFGEDSKYSNAAKCHAKHKTTYSNFPKHN